MMSADEAAEWSEAACFFAEHGRMPENLSPAVADEITNYPEEWQGDVNSAKYAIAMKSIDVTC
jgi:hypothetical protein